MSFYPNNPRNIKLIKNLQKEYEVRCCFLASKNQEILKQNQNDFPKGWLCFIFIGI